MSNRSRYSKYSARGKSLVTQRAKENKLENIEENDEINYENSPRCTVWDNELTKEEFTFNKQIVSYKQGRVYENNYEVKENQEKLEEVGKTIAENNLKKSNNVKVETASPDPFLCAKWMYELYMSQGIVPQTSPNDAEPTKLRLNSETRNNKMLTNEELDRKIQKEMIIAQHLGNNTPSNAIKLKPNLISVAQRTFAGNSYKPTILPKLNNLKSNFSEMTGATAMIEQRDQDLERALRNVRISLLRVYIYVVPKRIIEIDGGSRWDLW